MIKLISGISYSGKTTFKKLLSNDDKLKKDNYIIIDLDEEIEKNIKNKLSFYIKIYSEKIFRIKEYITLYNLIKKNKNTNKDLIIFLGGGFLTNIYNQDLIKKFNKNIKLYNLKISFQTYLKRLKKYTDNNKILAKDNIEFYNSRTIINNDLNPIYIKINDLEDLNTSYEKFKKALNI